MAVGVEADERLQYRRGHLEYERDDADLDKRQSVLVFDNGVDRRYHRLHHIVEQVGEADCDEYRENRTFLFADRKIHSLKLLFAAAKLRSFIEIFEYFVKLSFFLGQKSLYLSPNLGHYG